MSRCDANLMLGGHPRPAAPGASPSGSPAGGLGRPLTLVHRSRAMFIAPRRCEFCADEFFPHDHSDRCDWCRPA
ncbi:hypothetical protein [Muricoccus vinaceus]|uniref:Uncharacterized protein n=1 Tax=Muricoccus vinaceus TaxID=424704 RepID=A0ABV6INX1_9PROT